MTRERTDAQIIAFPAAKARPPSIEIGDLRFRALVGEAAWVQLPEATRARFGKRIAHCGTAIYAGEVIECKMSRAGWLFAQIARLIGGPLPISREVGVPAMVSVTEDGGYDGQFWTRIYGRRDRFPQVIHSSKRFCGPTGLEEHIGCGFGIALRAEVGDAALHFVSDHYFFTGLGPRLRLPSWLAPGTLRISHVDCNHGWFAFMLVLRHKVLGELIRQTAMFCEMRELDHP